MNTQDEKQLEAALRNLPHSIEPRRDLWPDIHARILQYRQRRQRRSWIYGFAAAAVLMVGVSTAWVGFLHLQAPDKTIAMVVPAPISGQPESNDLHLQFAAQLAGDRDLPPQARKALVDNLRVIQDAISRTQAALKKYPNDINLQALMFDLYQQQVRLMNEAQQTQIQATVRTTL
jgi:hypothetical protein